MLPPAYPNIYLFFEPADSTRCDASSIARLASWPSRFRPQAVFPQDESSSAARQAKASMDFGIDFP
jgi:hypothetical protein